MFNTSKPSFKKWVSLSAVLGFAAFLLYIYFFTDITDVAGVIGNTNIPTYALAFLTVLGGTVFNALTWRSILGNLSVKTTFRRVFNLSWVGIFVDAVVPGGWSGDIFKAYLLSKDPNADGAKTAASIVIKNVLELLVTLAALMTGMVLLALNYTLDFGVTIAIGATMFFLALPLIIVIYLSTNLRTTEKILKWTKRLSARIRGKQADASDTPTKIQNSLTEFHDGIMTMKTNPKSIIRPVLFQTLAWAFDILTLFLIFAAIGHAVGPDKVIITNTIVVNLQSQGVAFAGFAQVVSSTVYTVLGISSMVSIASTLLAGFASFWFKIILSFFAFQCTVFSHCIPFLGAKCVKGQSCEEGEVALLNEG
jgi:uncharacterized protein (TIRG00374 family)